MVCFGVSGVVSAVKAGTATITASATIDGDVYSATCEVTVSASKELSSIEVSNPKTSFNVDDSFSFGGTVTAHFNDSTTSDVTSSATFSGYDMSTAGDQTVTVSYTHGSITKTAEYEIKVKSGGGGGGEETTTYEFTSKSWGATPANWTSGKDGAGYLNSGVQVTTGASGANGTSPVSFDAVQSVTVTYCTNSSKGAGNIIVSVGSTQISSQSVTTSGGTTGRDMTFPSDRSLSGNINITVTCTTNSIYIIGCSITTGTDEPTEPTSISASLKEDKTFYVGETISKSDICVVTDLDEDVTSEVDFPDYQFKYSDASGGGVLADKEFTITYGDLPSTSLTVEVLRKAYVAPTGGTSFDIVSSTVFEDIGGGNNNLRDGTVVFDGITYEYKKSYYYSSGQAISFGNASNQTGYIVNETAFPSAISDVTVNSSGREVNVRYSVDGSVWVLKEDADVDANAYRYMKVDCIGNTGSNYSNIYTISVSLKAGDTAVNVANYIMFEDTNNQCLTKLNIAIGYLNTMSDEELSTFQNSEDYVISTARDRLEAWARNQGKTINYSGESEVSLSSALVNELTENLESSNALILILICALGSMLCLSTLLIIKKKKRK